MILVRERTVFGGRAFRCENYGGCLSYKQTRRPATSPDHSLEAKEVQHEVTWMMEVLDAFRTRLELIELDSAITGIHPNR